MSLPIQTEDVRMTSVRKQLLESLKDPEYRSEFVRERVRSSIALQIRALREQRNEMTQTQLGDAIGMAQTWVSKLENPEYGKMTVATLLRLATDAFDTDLEIKFRPFSETLDVLPEQDSSYFKVPGFSEEVSQLEHEQEPELSDALLNLAAGRDRRDNSSPAKVDLVVIPRPDSDGSLGEPPVAEHTQTRQIGEQVQRKPMQRAAA